MTREPNKSSLTTSNYNRSSLPDSMVKKNKDQDELDMWAGTGEGMLTIGTGTLSDSLSVSYDMGDIGQTNFDYDNDLRNKYPALKDAWDHYNNVKQLCESKEKEEDEN